MTRARRELHLVEPLRYYVTQQSRTGDRHVFGARSRFLTPAVLATLEATPFEGAPAQEEARLSATAARVDVASKLKSMW
jgi:DNA helicase-2/ATP-dependent DNA helicase PcrA